MGQLDFFPKTTENKVWGTGCIIQRNGRYLVGRRNKKTEKPTWSFLGGKVELGETPPVAIMRECMEEALILPIDFTFLGSFELDGVIDYIFNCHIFAGEPTPNPAEFSEFKWVTPEELMELELFPFSRRALELMAEWTSPKK